MAGNPIVHWEIMGGEGRGVSDFYAEVFDWAPQPWEGMDGYSGVDAEHGGVGGAVGAGTPELPNYVTVYVGVDSVDDHLARIEAAGGSIVRARTVIPGVVAFGLFRDPEGNMIGLAEHATPPAE